MSVCSLVPRGEGSDKICTSKLAPRATLFFDMELLTNGPVAQMDRAAVS